MLLLLLLLLLLQGLKRGVVGTELSKQRRPAPVLILSVPQPLKRLRSYIISGSSNGVDICACSRLTLRARRLCGPAVASAAALSCALRAAFCLLSSRDFFGREGRMSALQSPVAAEGGARFFLAIGWGT